MSIIASRHDVRHGVRSAVAPGGLACLAVLVVGIGTGTATAVRACTTSSELTLSALRGMAGDTVKVLGSGFASGPVSLHWGSLGGRTLAVAQGPAFSQPITIPSDTAGAHYVVASDGAGPKVYVVAPFELDIAPTPTPAPEPPATGSATGAVVATLAPAAVPIVKASPPASPLPHAVHQVSTLRGVPPVTPAPNLPQAGVAAVVDAPAAPAHADGGVGPPVALRTLSVRPVVVQAPTGRSANAVVLAIVATAAVAGSLMMWMRLRRRPATPA